MKQLVFALCAALSLALAAAPAAKTASADPNAYATYGKAMAPVKGDPMAVEWQQANRAALVAATSEERLEAYLESPRAAKALLAQVKPAYETSPVVATVIAAVTQYTVENAGTPWYVFWRFTRDGERRLWTEALLGALEAAEDDYVRQFMLEQLRWCAYADQAARIRAFGAGQSKCVADMADMVVRELAGETARELGE